MNIRSEIIKPFEKTGGMFLDIGLGDDFLHLTSKGKQILLGSHLHVESKKPKNKKINKIQRTDWQGAKSRVLKGEKWAVIGQMVQMSIIK